MEREPDSVIVVDDEAAQAFLPLDLAPLYGSTRARLSAEEIDDLPSTDHPTSIDTPDPQD